MVQRKQDMGRSRAVPFSRVNQYPMTQEHYLLKFQSFVLLLITSNCKNFQSYRCYSYFSFEHLYERMIYYRLWLIVLHPNWYPVFALFEDFSIWASDSSHNISINSKRKCTIYIAKSKFVC